MFKKSEIMLAVWPNADLRQYWGSVAGCNSLWLSLRDVTQERDDKGETKIDMDCYSQNGKACSDVGIYIWAGTGGGLAIELKGHEIHSASAHELTALAKWLTKMNAKISKADIPHGFGVKETLVLTLRAMGVKNALVIDPDWRSAARDKVITLDEALKMPNYGGPLSDMEAMRVRPYGDAP